jgi:hypothetical protein
VRAPAHRPGLVALGTVTVPVVADERVEVRLRYVGPAGPHTLLTRELREAGFAIEYPDGPPEEFRDTGAAETIVLAIIASGLYDLGKAAAKPAVKAAVARFRQRLMERDPATAAETTVAIEDDDPDTLLPKRRK